MLLGNAKTLAQFRLEECTDAGLEQDRLAIEILDQQTAAGQRNRIALIGRDPLLPNRFRRIAEHRTAIKTLRVAD